MEKLSNSGTKNTKLEEMRYLLFLGVVTISVLLVFVRLGLVVANQILFPFDLVFETSSLSTILAFRDGVNPYAASTYDAVPFNLTMYTPLYHLVVSWLPQSDGNPFLTGRLVTLVSMIGALCGAFAVSGRRGNRLLPLVGAAVFFCLPFAIQSSTMVRCDAFALMLSVWAVVAIARMKADSHAYVIAAVLAVLAVATKQSFGAAFLTCSVFLFIRHRSTLPRFLLVSGVGGSLLAGIAQIWFGSGFWFSTIAAAANPMTWAQASKVLSGYLTEPSLVTLSILSILAVFSCRRQMDRSAIWHSPYFLYMAISTLVLLLTVGKNGSAENYFYEVIVAQVMWLVDAFRGDVRDQLRRWKFQVGLGAICCCLLVDVVPVRYKPYLATPVELQKARIAGSSVWKEMLRSQNLEDPKVLHLNTHLFTHDLQRRAVFSDPLLYQLLWKSGKLSHETLLDAIDQQSFHVIIGSKEMRFSKPLNDAFQGAIDDRYVLWKRTPYGDCYLPKD